MAKIVAFVAGGVLDDIVDLNGDSVDYFTIDYDNLEAGDCQFCGGELELINPIKTENKTIQTQAIHSEVRDDIGYPYLFEEPAVDALGNPIMRNTLVTIVTGGENYCPKCDFNWTKATPEDILEFLRQREEKEADQ